MIRLGRISYANMAPVFFRVDAEYEEITGVPTELNRRLIAGEIDTAPISSIEYARHADSLLLLPRLCVSSEGAVDSIQLISRLPLDAISTVAVTPESATSVVLTKVLLPAATHVPLGEEADAKLLIGDAALKSAFEDPTPHHDLGRLWLERTGLPMVFAVWAAPEPAHPGLLELEDALVESVRAARAEPETLAFEAADRLRLSRRFPRPLLREAALPLRPARARRALHVPRARAGRRRARRGARAAVRRREGGGLMAVSATVDGILEKALDGARIDDAEALALLESRDLVAVGRAANELRARRTDPSRITFIVDRNLNYTNVCVTDCDFCAFYRSPG